MEPIYRRPTQIVPLPCIRTLSNTHTSGSFEEPPPGHCSGNSDGLGGHVGIHNGMGHEVSDTLMEDSVIVILWGGEGRLSHHYTAAMYNYVCIGSVHLNI